MAQQTNHSLWVFAIGGAFAFYGWYHAWIASVVLVIFTFFVPVILGRESSG
jgi:hypothetical protein